VQQLSWLVEKSTGNAPDAYLKQLQQKILECDRKGATNASIPLSKRLQPRAVLPAIVCFPRSCCTQITSASSHLTLNLPLPADETVDALRMLTTASTPQEVDAVLQPMLAS
jgi:hypothetical protein